MFSGVVLAFLVMIFNNFIIGITKKMFFIYIFDDFGELNVAFVFWSSLECWSIVDQAPYPYG